MEETKQLIIMQRNQFFLYHPKINIRVGNQRYISKFGENLKLTLPQGKVRVIYSVFWQTISVDVDLNRDTILESYYNRVTGDLKVTSPNNPYIIYKGCITQLILNIIAIIVIALFTYFYINMLMEM